MLSIQIDLTQKQTTELKDIENLAHEAHLKKKEGIIIAQVYPNAEVMECVFLEGKYAERIIDLIREIEREDNG